MVVDAPDSPPSKSASAIVNDIGQNLKQQDVQNLTGSLVRMNTDKLYIFHIKQHSNKSKL